MNFYLNGTFLKNVPTFDFFSAIETLLLFISEEIFLIKDNFESSLIPLSIPTSMVQVVMLLNHLRVLVLVIFRVESRGIL